LDKIEAFLRERLKMSEEVLGASHPLFDVILPQDVLAEIVEIRKPVEPGRCGVCGESMDGLPFAYHEYDCRRDSQ